MFDGIDGETRTGCQTPLEVGSGDGTAAAPLRLYGALDADGARCLGDTFMMLANSAAQDVVLDLAGVGFIDGTGIGLLAFLFRRLAARRHALCVIGATGQPLTTLRDLGLANVLGVPDNRRAEPRRRQPLAGSRLGVRVANR